MFGRSMDTGLGYAVYLLSVNEPVRWIGVVRAVTANKCWFGNIGCVASLLLWPGSGGGVKNPDVDSDRVLRIGVLE